MSEDNAPKIDTAILLDLTARIVSAYAGNVSLSPEELVAMISTVSGALTQLSTANAEPAKKDLIPAVPVKKSVTPEFIICLEDGKKLKMLKRHLMSTYGMTPADYRTKWGLSHDYPMVAPVYAALRSELAKKIGLGRTSPRFLGDAVSLKASAGRRGRPAKLAA
jgi:predicted transcriptional regulator